MAKKEREPVRIDLLTETALSRKEKEKWKREREDKAASEGKMRPSFSRKWSE